MYNLYYLLKKKKIENQSVNKHKCQNVKIRFSDLNESKRLTFKYQSHVGKNK